MSFIIKIKRYQIISIIYQSRANPDQNFPLINKVIDLIGIFMPLPSWQKYLLYLINLF